MSIRSLLRLLLPLAALAATAWAQAAAPQSRFFTTSDGVKIHYLDAGSGPAIVFIPGWTMPGDIFDSQIRYFARHYRVIAVDPRSQGESDKVAEGHYPERRSRDYKELIDNLKIAPAVIVGWSLAVQEMLAYVDQFGPGDIRGLVLIDTVPALPEKSLPGFLSYLHNFQANREKVTRDFVRAMYKKPQSEEYLQRITQAALRTPTNTAVALSAGVLGRLDWSAALDKLGDHPLMFVCAGYYKKQLEEIKHKRPATQTEIFDDAGHALFVDDADRFNEVLQRFVQGLKQ